MNKRPIYDSKKTRYWVEAVKKGQIGKFKDVAGKDLAGRRVIFVGWMGRQPWVKLLERAGSMEQGATFSYLLKWIDWEV